jgi:hypothetical protein
MTYANDNTTLLDEMSLALLVLKQRSMYSSLAATPVLIQTD